jgi:hypothetical protein
MFDQTPKLSQSYATDTMICHFFHIAVSRIVEVSRNYGYLAMGEVGLKNNKNHVIFFR